jgi:very-short-patch-repair endonuclease
MSAKTDRHRWRAPAHWWDKLKPLAQQMRHKPTPAENLLWQRLRNRQVGGVKFRRQHAIERFIVDFYAAREFLAIEVDGEIHCYTPEEDAIRQRFLEDMGIRVLRFSNQEVIDDIDGVIEQIAAVLKDSCWRRRY